MERFKGGVHINAPVSDVWDVITKIGAGADPIAGVEEIIITPNAERLEPGMEITLKIGFAVVRGLVRVRIDEVNDEQHYFSTSIMDARLDKPMKINDIGGRLIIGLLHEARNGNEETNLQYLGKLRVPFLLRPLIMPIKTGLVDAGILPSVGERIATAVQKRHSWDDGAQQSDL